MSTKHSKSQWYKQETGSLIGNGSLKGLTILKGEVKVHQCVKNLHLNIVGQFQNNIAQWKIGKTFNFFNYMDPETRPQIAAFWLKLNNNA